ncbi:protein of unknown function [Micromonospora pattaloongensis]|uniref:DUF397 domain-containing protein n=1 Tax=Micromonospora pattaloongensis TaxID=405436 RepID=A0A1H3NY33_9ACTN|nr:DUF397 domain-containing protein [Micromonospora pattaloongensis]SDY93603.1 protein of unknown function [Micromonospora pattaloongensis]
MECPDTARATWRKSTRSNGSGNCVEVAELAGGIGVRDSKNLTGGLLIFAAPEWSTFIGGIKHGSFND